MKFAVSVTTPEVAGEATLALLEGCFEEKLAKAKAYGYDGVELVMSNPDMLRADQVKELLRQNGLQAAAIASGCIAGTRNLTLLSPDGDIRAQAFGALQELVGFAAGVGASVVTIGSFKGLAAPVGGAAQARGLLQDTLSKVNDLAAKHGVQIALEAMTSLETDFLNTAQEVVAYLESIGLSHVRLLLDTFHMFMSKEDPEAVIRSHAGYLAHVHLADSERLPVGLGQVPFARIEKALLSVGYAGWQSAELARNAAPDENAAVTLRNIKTLL